MKNIKTPLLFGILLFASLIFGYIAHAEEVAQGCCTITCPGIAPHSTTEYPNNCPVEVNGCTGVFTPGKIAALPNGESCVDANVMPPSPKTTTSPITYTAQISIPGSEFIAGKGIQLSESAILLAKYIIAIFKYLIGVIGIIASITLTIAGVRWLSAAGNQTVITEVKKSIMSSLTGLGLALGSFLILMVINTSLVNFTIPDIKYIQGLDLKESLSEDEYKVNTATNYPMYKGESANNNQYFVLEGSFKSIYSLFSIQDIGANNTFDPPDSVPIILQCGDQVRNMNYSRQGETNCSCTENSGKNNEECQENYSTICSSGCGVIAFQMVIGAYLGGHRGTAATKMIAGFMEDHPEVYRVCGSGTSVEGMMALARSIGLEAEKVESNERDYVDRLVAAGYPVMVSVGAASGCTNGGHWIVLTGKNGNKYTVNNPSLGHPECQSEVPSNIKGVSKFLFIHPPGEPNINRKNSCIGVWDYGCRRDDDCCTDPLNPRYNKCVNIDFDTNGKKCGCIATYHYTCTKPADCCNPTDRCINFNGETAKKCAP